MPLFSYFEYIFSDCLYHSALLALGYGRRGLVVLGNAMIVSHSSISTVHCEYKKRKTTLKALSFLYLLFLAPDIYLIRENMFIGGNNHISRGSVNVYPQGDQ